MNQNIGVSKMLTQPDFFEVSELTSEEVNKKTVLELREILNAGTENEKRLAEAKLEQIREQEREENSDNIKKYHHA